MRGRNQECYLVVGVGWNCSFNLCTGKTDASAGRGSDINDQRTTGAPCISTCCMCTDIHVFLLPALTLAVLDKGQLDELVFHEGGPHQL